MVTQAMDNILTDLSDNAMINAIETSLFDLIKIRSLWPHAEVRDSLKMLSCFTDVPSPNFIVILRANHSESAIDTAIKSALERCKKHKVTIIVYDTNEMIDDQVTFM